MILYKTLRELPFITCMEIMYTGNLLLLTDDPETPIEELAELWMALEEKFQAVFNSGGQKKVFNVTKEIEYLLNKYQTIVNACVSLEFDVSEPLIEMLREFGYKFRMEFYNDDLIRVYREANAIHMKVSQLKSTLPKESENPSEDWETDIYQQMAAYSSLLSIDFDFDKISCMKYKAIEHQVKSKIKALESQATKQKTKKR